MTEHTKDATDWRPLVMTRNSLIRTAIMGTVFAAAVSSSGFAQDGTVSGAWKINAARFYDGHASLYVERNTSAPNQMDGEFLVVEGTNVYLATGMDGHAMPANGAKMADISHAGGKLVLIGTHAHRTDACTVLCRYGQPERKMAFRFDTVEGTEQLMGEMVAYNKR